MSSIESAGRGNPADDECTGSHLVCIRIEETGNLGEGFDPDALARRGHFNNTSNYYLRRNFYHSCGVASGVCQITGV